MSAGEIAIVVVCFVAGFAAVSYLGKVFGDARALDARRADLDGAGPNRVDDDGRGEDRTDGTGTADGKRTGGDA